MNVGIDLDELNRLTNRLHAPTVWPLVGDLGNDAADVIERQARHIKALEDALAGCEKVMRLAADTKG